MLTASPKEMVRPRKVYGFILKFFLIVATMLAVECNFSKVHIFWGTFTYMPLFNDVFSLIPGTFLRSQILRIFFIVSQFFPSICMGNVDKIYKILIDI